MTSNTQSNLKGVLMKGWFSEVNEQWPGQAMSLEIEEILFEKQSEFQHVLVFKSKTWGNVLVLDGVIQLTEKDEMAYQEMIVHLPLYSHSNPESVLIIGGGDGGVIREIVKHSSVKNIVICEIDRVVIDAGKKYFPSVAAAWDDPRVTLHCGDGAVFMKKPENESAYDCIITDSSDPIGPAQSLFETPFYQAMNSALKPGGRICTQAESMWVHLELIKKLVKDASMIYNSVEYATTQIPTYPCGQIGLLLCSKSGGKTSRSKTLSIPSRSVPLSEVDNYKYYSSELHQAAFVLPAFVQRAIAEAKEEADQMKKQTISSAKKSSKRKASVDTATATSVNASDDNKKTKIESTSSPKSTKQNPVSPKQTLASPKQTSSAVPESMAKAISSPQKHAMQNLASNAHQVASSASAVNVAAAASPKQQAMSPKQQL